MTDQIKNYWFGLEVRERWVLGGGGVTVAAILSYTFLFHPWHRALSEMGAALPALRQELTWMRQQSAVLEGGGNGNISVVAQKGADQSLLSVIEQTSRSAKLKKAIQQMTPAAKGSEVRVVLEDANFNQWLRWIDQLYQLYGVDIKQVDAERDEDKPNIAEIRVTFIRAV